MKLTRFSIGAGWWRSLTLFMLMLLTVQFFRREVGTFSVVEGFSMYPTFLPNDVVQARTLHAELRRGDVVIVADTKGEEMIKRVIGLPGETVSLFRGFVYINHRRLIEPYLPKFTYTFKRDESSERSVSWPLGAGQYFVLGDNRLHSADSRHYGPLARHQILRIVDTPANTRPELSDIILLESGEVLRIGPSEQQRAATP
ncbi:MAG TPA: signal peptidase I [Verrucomicrobiae bacterium]|nr:signal peptidase I [Verrucomicrobiae bacterium]